MAGAWGLEPQTFTVSIKRREGLHNRPLHSLGRVRNKALLSPPQARRERSDFHFPRLSDWERLPSIGAGFTAAASLRARRNACA